MPQAEWFDVARGPFGILNQGTTATYLTPSDTNDSTNIINADQPLKKDTTSVDSFGSRVVRCDDDDIPQLIALERSTRSNQPIGCIEIPIPVAGSVAITSATITLKLPISNAGSPPAGAQLAVCANAVGTWKLVAPADGIGRVKQIDAAGYAIVEF